MSGVLSSLPSLSPPLSGVQVSPLAPPSMAASLTYHESCLAVDPDYVKVGAPASTPSNLSSGRPAAAAELRALSAVPSAMASSSRPNSLRKKKNKGLVRNGTIVARTYPVLGNRPYPPVGSLNQQIRVSMEAIGSLLTTSTVASTYASYNLVVSSLGGSTGYLQLFDQYRIEQIEVWIDPVNLVTTSGIMATAVDLDDSNTPTTFNQVQDKQGALVATAGLGRYHKWLPHMAIAAFSGAFTSYMSIPSGWIDSASPSVQHYGLKVAAPATTPAVNYQLTVRAIVSWRAPNIN